MMSPSSSFLLKMTSQHTGLLSWNLNLLVRNAVTNDVVDAGTAGCRKPFISKRRRIRAMGQDILVHLCVYMLGAYPWLRLSEAVAFRTNMTRPTRTRLPAKARTSLASLADFRSLTSSSVPRAIRLSPSASPPPSLGNQLELAIYGGRAMWGGTGRRSCTLFGSAVGSGGSTTEYNPKPSISASSSSENSCSSGSSAGDC